MNVCVTSRKRRTGKNKKEKGDQRNWEVELNLVTSGATVVNTGILS